MAAADKPPARAAKADPPDDGLGPDAPRPPVVRKLTAEEAAAEQAAADAAWRAASGLPDLPAGFGSTGKAPVYAELAKRAGHPQWYVAARDLPVGDEMGAEAIAPRAFAPGDLVPAAHVERYGWAPYVTPPQPESAPASASKE